MSSLNQQLRCGRQLAIFGSVHVSNKPTRAKTRPDESRLPLRILRVVNTCFARHFHHLEVLSPCPLPPTGPAILVCNHISGLDPVLIQSASKRLIVWMMAREYYEI